MNARSVDNYRPGNRVAYGIGQLSDLVAYQSFTFLIFTFYYAVVGIDVNSVTIGFIIWSIWNAINDPLIGLISDKTKTRYGRRLPYIAASFIPISLLMYFLWTPPVEPVFLSFVYFVIVILLFDGLYTMNSLNLTALFPEMWLSPKERASANNVRQIFGVLGLIVAFLVPTLLITDLSATVLPRDTVIAQYQSSGALLALVVAAGYLIALKWGIRERREFSQDSLSVPQWGAAFKYTLHNRSFQWFVVANSANWYVYGLIPTIIPLYGQFALGIGEGESLLLGILLAAAFISGGCFMSLWRFLVNRWKDLRKTWIVSMATWILALVPLFFVNDVTIAVLVFVLNGIGLSGSLYMRDLVIADVIDEDEAQTGVRREGAFFGINAILIRLAVILVFLSISLVFNNVGWTVFTPETSTPEVILGLRALMGLFPSAALVIGILAMLRYPLIGERLRAVKDKLDEVHKEKARHVEGNA